MLTISALYVQSDGHVDGTVVWKTMEADGPLGKDFDETCASVKIAMHSLRGSEEDNWLINVTPKQIYEKLHKILPPIMPSYTPFNIQLDLPKMHF